MALVNSTTDTLKKLRLSEMTDRAWFSQATEPGRDTISQINDEQRNKFPTARVFIAMLRGLPSGLCKAGTTHKT